MGSKYVMVWLLAASALVIAVLLGACSGGDSDSSKFPIDLTGSRVAAGEEIYAQNCASCHGPVQGPVVPATAPVHDDAGHTWHHPDRTASSVGSRSPTACHGHAGVQGRPLRRTGARSARLHQKHVASRDTGTPGPGLKAVRGPGHRRRDRMTVKYLRAPRLVQQYWPGQEAPCVRPESWTP